MKPTKIILFLTMMLLCVPRAGGQIYYETLSQYENMRNGNPTRTDWMNASENRYTIAIRPLYLLNNGIKLDFEFELPRKGSWLQIDGIIRLNTFDDNYYVSHCWEAGDNWFTKLNGFGIGAYYKTYFRANGWYYDIGVLLNYYGVDKPGIISENYVEDGLTFLRYDRKMIHWNFVKPSLNFNIGKQFALTQTLFLDVFGGIGYTYSIHSAETYKYFASYDPRAFSYSGLYVSGGFRIGILWSRGNKQ